MNKRQKIIVSIVGIFIVLLALVGITYGYFLTRIQGNTNTTSISVTTADLKVDYIEGDSDGDGTPDPLIVVQKIRPKTVIAEKVFSVKNSGNSEASYSVILDEMENDFDRNQDLVYTLTKSGVADPVATGYLAVGTHQVILPNVDIAKDVTDTYTLKLEYIDPGVDQSIDMNKSLRLRVNIDNPIYTWDTAPSGSLLYALKENQPSGTETTIPGREGSTENEARILTAEDDYGTSYVYRGNVTNNYVNYSGMCWRIVRVQGDGTIKLALADENGECNREEYDAYVNVPYESSWDRDFMNIKATINGGTTYSFGNNLNYDISNIPSLLETWAINKGLAMEKDNTIFYDQNITFSDWCNDTSIAYKERMEWDIINVYYMPYERLNVGETANPTLKCNMKGLDDTSSARFRSGIAILSVDEIVFSGSYGTQNMFAYLNFDINGGQYNYWTLSPSHIYDYTRYVHTNFDYGQISDFLCIRPSVVLRSDVMLDKNISGQNGTYSAPYIIN